LEHGYCRSVYVTDPNDMIVEFTLDNPDAEKVAPQRRQKARAELDQQHLSLKSVGGDCRSNHCDNAMRPAAPPFTT
jgi:hypothetical protein